VAGRSLGALGQRLLRPHRRTRLRRELGRVLPPLSRCGCRARTSLRRPLRARRNPALARLLPRQLPTAAPAGGGTARSRRGAPSRSSCSAAWAHSCWPSAAGGLQPEPSRDSRC
jgi:hypothetical protein